jgi:hypothetical protein
MRDLVIGGTGMLAGVVRAMCRSGRRPTVLARGAARLAALAVEAPCMTALAIDYADDAALAAGLGGAGPFQRCVAWIHDHAPQAPLIAASHTIGVYVHVLSSAVSNPADPETLGIWRRRFAQFPAIAYRQCILGFVLGDKGARWLTDQEICDGVLAALTSEQPCRVVGTVRPWSRRP